MPSLAYKMIATQFTEQQWNKMISPAIQATLNAAAVVQNLAHAVLYGPETYQRLAVQNPFFLQQIIHITALMTEAVCNSSTGKLLRYSAETFRVEIGIPFSLTATRYDEKTIATYCPPCWYKSLWRFMSKPVYKLDICEDYPDLQPLRVNDVFLMQSFVDSGFKGADLKSLNFTRKFLEAITLADIATVDGRRITQQAFQAIASNGLRAEINWPKAVPGLTTTAIMLLNESYYQVLYHLWLFFCGRKLSPSPSSISILAGTDR